MRIKMSEYFQGTGVSAVLVRTGSTVDILTPNEVYEVDSSLGEYLLSNRKGVEHSGKVDKVEPKPETVTVHENVTNVDTVSVDASLMTSTNQPKRGRK